MIMDLPPCAFKAIDKVFSGEVEEMQGGGGGSLPGAWPKVTRPWHFSSATVRLGSPDALAVVAEN
jgi:hypothetical protein